MGLNKKGFFFTGIVIVIFSLFFLSYTLYSSIQERKAIQQRVATMNNFIYSIEQDLQRQLFIAGFRSIFILENQITSSGEYIADSDEHFQSIFFNGTFLNQSQELMLGATYQNIILSSQEKAASLNIDMNFSSPLYEVTQEDPWNVKFTLSLNLKAEDKAGLASWNKTENVIALVPIEYFEDPIYYISTGGKFSLKFKKTPYTFSPGDTTNLSLHAQDMYYAASLLAPSFLDRLQGITTENPQGIESFVNLLTTGYSAPQESSVIDYQLFYLSTSGCYVQGTPSWFRIDPAHLTLYNATCS